MVETLGFGVDATTGQSVGVCDSDVGLVEGNNRLEVGEVLDVKEGGADGVEDDQSVGD